MRDASTVPHGTHVNIVAQNGRTILDGTFAGATSVGVVVDSIGMPMLIPFDSVMTVEVDGEPIGRVTPEPVLETIPPELE